MSGDGGRPRKRRKSFVMNIMEKMGFGGGQDDEEEQQEPPAAVEQPGRAETVGRSAAAATPAAPRLPSQSRRSRQTLQEAARSALRALGESGADHDAAGAASTSKARGKGKGKGKVKSEAGEGEDEEEDVSSRTGKGKGKGKGRARRGGDPVPVVKTENDNSAGSSADLDDLTEDEALTSVTYGGKPLVNMRVADCKDALTKFDLRCTGNLPELRLRLARRLCSDLAQGTPGLAGIQGFEGASSPGSGLEFPEKPSARGARRQRRRTSTMLKKGPDTKDSPIIISGSDDESNARASAETPAAAGAAAVPPVVDTSVTAVASADTSALEAMPQRSGKRKRAARDATEAEAEAEVSKQTKTKTTPPTKALAKALADGPKPGMTFAELREAVKALGLKPKGRKKSDLEECWLEAAKGTAKEGEGKQAGAGAGEGRRGRTPPLAGDAEPSVDGVRVKDMKVSIIVLFFVRTSKRALGCYRTGRCKGDMAHVSCSSLPWRR